MKRVKDVKEMLRKMAAAQRALHAPHQEQQRWLPRGLDDVKVCTFIYHRDGGRRAVEIPVTR